MDFRYGRSLVLSSCGSESTAARSMLKEAEMRKEVPRQKEMKEKEEL